jgi:hypothetical protein
MTYSNVSLIDLIRAGELRPNSQVSVTLPRNMGVCTGVLKPNGKIAFGCREFTLNKFVKQLFGYGPNGWTSVCDEHGVTLSLVRARYSRARGIEPTIKRNGNVRRPTREPTNTFDHMRLVGVVVSDGIEERVIRT